MPRTSYVAECFVCEWNDPNATSTASARRHRDQTGHTTACSVGRDFIYRAAGPRIAERQIGDQK